MGVQSLVVFVVTFQTVFAQQGAPCTTPNKEKGTCVAVRSCQVIIDAITTQQASAIAFAKESQCGYDTQPLVCCGSFGSYSDSDTLMNVPNLFNILTTPNPFDVLSKPATENAKVRETITTNVTTNGLPDRTVCGFDQGWSRITGGEVTEMEEFPWMAALEYKSKLSGQNAGIRCGGSVINTKYILTAAQCVVNTEFELIRVWLGEWKISTDPDCENLLDTTYCADNVQKLKVKTKLPHPFYDQITGDHDIALVKLENNINYTSYISPICLPQADLPLPQYGSYLTVAGWGATENGTSSDIKLKVSIPLISMVKCHKKLKNYRSTTANQLCAGGEERRGTCRGDSGGPVMRRFEDKHSERNQWYQEGVISYGVGCGHIEYPAVYTRINRYITWILNYIKQS